MSNCALVSLLIPFLFLLIKKKKNMTNVVTVHVIHLT